jgi:hypothetical protein
MSDWASFYVLVGSSGAALIGMQFVVMTLIRRARRRTYCEPVWQDWRWYAVLPCAGYAALGLGAAVLRTDAPPHRGAARGSSPR